MNKNQSLKLASLIFGIIALLHLLRSIANWSIIVNGFSIPVWFSYVAAFVFGYLAWKMHSAGNK